MDLQGAGVDSAANIFGRARARFCGKVIAEPKALIANEFLELVWHAARANNYLRGPNRL